MDGLCWGPKTKVQYDTEELADRAILSKPLPVRVRLHSYECPMCKKWHMTSSRRPPTPLPLPPTRKET